MSSTTNWQANFTNFFKGRGKIQQLAELTAVQAMAATAADNQRNQEAESACIRRTLWGEQEAPSGEAEDMATTILGDITHPTPIIMNQPPPSNPLLPIALAALAGVGGTGLLGAGAIAGYLLSPKPPKAEPVEFNDETLSIGLGRIEDYIASEKE